MAAANVVIDHAAKQEFAVVDGSLAITVAKGDLPTSAATSGIVTLTENAGDRSVHRAVSFSTAVKPFPAPALSSGGSIEMSLIAILLSALAGGVLLNLMPCVFPVLAMKALALVGHASEVPRRRIVGGVAYTAGILVSFAILGGLLLVLKAGGSVVGWGFQLQTARVSPDQTTAASAEAAVDSFCNEQQAYSSAHFPKAATGPAGC